MQNYLFVSAFLLCVTHLFAEKCSDKCVNVLTTVKCHKICITTSGNSNNGNGIVNNNNNNGNNNNNNDKDGGNVDTEDYDNIGHFGFGHSHNGNSNTNNENSNSNNNNSSSNNLDINNGASKNSTNNNSTTSEGRDILDLTINGLETIIEWFNNGTNSTDGIIGRCIGVAKGLKVAMPIILFKLGVIVTIVSFLTIFSLKTLGMLGTLLFVNFGGAFSRIFPATGGQIIDAPHPQNIHYHFHNRRLQYLNSQNERNFQQFPENMGTYNNQMPEQNNNEVSVNQISEPVNYDETDINHIISWDRWDKLLPVPDEGYENNYHYYNNYNYNN